MKKIVVLRPHEQLHKSFVARSASMALDYLHSDISTPPGVTYSKKPPVPMPVPRPGPAPVSGLALSNGIVATPLGSNYAIEVDFADEAAERQFVKDNARLIVGIYSNPQVAPALTVCPTGSVGVIANVEEQINTSALHGLKHRGQGVRIAVVDKGIDKDRIDVAGGSAIGVAKPGETVSGHGTMVAVDARIAAPDATFLDFPLLQEVRTEFSDLLYDAMGMYHELATLLLQEPGPLVVVNSWWLYDRALEAPPGDPQNYSANPLHPFNQWVGILASAGADIYFAAGNCGGPCPFPICGKDDRGGSHNVLGANSHADVTTVGAVTVEGHALGYSSMGPGKLYAQKPDFVASSHFDGSGIGAVPGGDTGTSAACGVAAGAAAALRSMPCAQPVSPARLKLALIASARKPAGVPAGWDPQFGWGIIDLGRAAAFLKEVCPD